MKPRRPTPKQRLRSHIVNDHHRQPAASWTMRQLADWHARQHHRYRLGHFHAGENLGPNARPPGWRTGQDARPTSWGLAEAEKARVLGNTVRREGCDLCAGCGCKYWENDRCIDCGGTEIREESDQ